jgi:signal transduction histidine kinase
METPQNLTSSLLVPLVESLPVPPRSQRALRYSGEECAVAMSSLSSSDRVAVSALYDLLTSFAATLRATESETDDVQQAETLARGFDLDGALAVARVIGAGEEPMSDDVRQALHDVRGGALTSLLVEVQRMRLGRGERRVRALRTLTSDHLKIMRHALLELDDVRRADDLAPREHPVERLAETLLRVIGNGPDGAVDVVVECTFIGGVTMSCVELGALDRAVLNLVNNAVRHSAGTRVEVLLAHAGPSSGSDLRVCVANQIRAVDAGALRDRFGDDLLRIFVEPFTTTGSGDGLKICLDLVASAYGLVLGADALRAGLLGATIERGWFVAWLCWPAVA